MAQIENKEIETKTPPQGTRRAKSSQARPSHATSAESPAAPKTATAADGIVNAWLDDPLNKTTIQRPVPNLSNGSLAYQFSGVAVPAAPYNTGTANFRYWTAAEALCRGAEFWIARISSLKWQTGPSLTVILDDGLDFNAYYDRNSLTFFHGEASSGTVYSGESPDIVCHEMGHAILDGFKPQLWNTASHEVAAFHESFGDMSAILVALQLPLMRKSVLDETSGHINRNSRLSKLAEQLGAAIREQHPDAVDRDCLRNAANRFIYESPLLLKSGNPASMLSSEPHSFSRVFTGAFLDALSGMLIATAANPSTPTEQELQHVSEQMGDILMAGIRQASVVSNFYAQVAAGMVQACGAINQSYPRVLKAAFIKRDILSLHSATTIESLSAVTPSMLGIAPGVMTDSYSPVHLALDGNQYGLGQRPLIVETASQPRRFSANAAASDFGSLQAPGAETAARGFVEELFKRGKIDYGSVCSEETRLDPILGLKTHKLVDLGGSVRLERSLCDCGLCPR